jgi:PAS domain S-box-containing protein
MSTQTKISLPPIANHLDGDDFLRTFIELTPASIAMFDREMKYLAVSRRWMEDFSLGDNDIIGVSHYELMRDIPDKWKTAHRKGLSGETIKNDEDRFERDDGTIYWLKWEILPWRLNNGLIGGIIIFSENISKYKRATEEIGILNANLEERLEELRVHQIELEMQNETLRTSKSEMEISRDRYLNLYEFATVSYITLSKTGQIAAINLTGAELLGEARKNLLHRRFDEFILPENKDHWHHFYLKLIKGGEKQNCDLQMSRLNGTQLHVLLICHPINLLDDAKEIHITLIDNTEQKRKQTAKHHLKSLLSTLTRRERDVLALALKGLPNKEIANILNVHLRTIENHKARIHSKTGVDSLLKLSHIATSAGITLNDVAELTTTSS